MEIIKELILKPYLSDAFHVANLDRVLYLLKVYWYLKTFIIMARYKTRFFDMAEECYHIHISVDAVKAEKTKDFIQIVFNNEREKDSFRHIWLDKSTAIKFAKTLRTEINKIQE